MSILVLWCEYSHFLGFCTLGITELIKYLHLQIGLMPSACRTPSLMVIGVTFKRVHDGVKLKTRTKSLHSIDFSFKYLWIEAWPKFFTLMAQAIARVFGGAQCKAA
jgi:hypothetical protein